jgi:hypothetical protein
VPDLLGDETAEANGDVDNPAALIVFKYLALDGFGGAANLGPSVGPPGLEPEE